MPIPDVFCTNKNKKSQTQDVIDVTHDATGCGQDDSLMLLNNKLPNENVRARPVLNITNVGTATIARPSTETVVTEFECDLLKKAVIILRQRRVLDRCHI